MRVSKTIVFGLIALFICNSFVLGQDRIDSLRSVLDMKRVPDSTLVKTSVELCKEVVNTDKEYLIPEYAREGLEADTLNHFIQCKFSLYEFLGNYYWRMGKLNEAAHQFNQMRLLGESLADNANIAKSYNGLGTVYFLMENYSKALEYYHQGLALSGTDSLLKIRIYNNLANTFIQQNIMDSAFPYYNKSVIYHQSHKNYEFLASVYTNIALAYKELKNGIEVRRNINLALEAAIKANNPFRITSVYRTMGVLAFDSHPEMAAKCFEKALELARKSKSYDQIRSCLWSLSDLADNAGQYKKEIAYLREMKNIVDSLDLEQKKSSLQGIESVYLITRKDIAKIEETRQAELKIIKEKNRQKILITFLFAACAGILILLLMGLKTYRLRMKITRTKERFFTMIAHDIRNPFSGILGLSGLLKEEAEKSDDPVHRKQVSSLHQSLTHVYELLENMLQWSQAETGKIAFNPSIQLLSPLVHDVICLNTAKVKQKGIRLENQVQSEFTARFDSNMLQTVIRNLLSNAIKFSPENSSIFISAEVQGRKVVVKVRDEGIGMSREQSERIFKADQNISTTGTQNETGTGLGLIMCRDFIIRHGGRIWCESKPDEGTSMLFTLPD